MAKKYSFQRNKKKTLTWLIAIAAVIVVAAIGIVIYNGSTSGDIPVAPLSDESLNHIAENWKVLESHTNKVLNYYAGATEDGTDGNGGTMLAYMPDSAVDVAYIYIKPLNSLGAIENVGMFARPNIFTTDLGQLFSGEISLKETTVALQAGNENCLIYIEDYNAEKVDDSALATIVAELEALIAQGPMVVEEPAEEATEAAE